MFPANKGSNAPERILAKHESNAIKHFEVFDQGKSKMISEIKAVEKLEIAGPQGKEKSVGDCDLLLQTQPHNRSSSLESNRHSVAHKVTDQAIQKFLVFSKGQISKTLLRSGFTVPELRAVCEFLAGNENLQLEQETKLSSLGKEALIQIVLFRLASAQPSAIAPNCNPQFSSKKRKDSGPSEDTTIKSSTQFNATTGTKKTISGDETKQVNHVASLAQYHQKLKQVNSICCSNIPLEPCKRTKSLMFYQSQLYAPLSTEHKNTSKGTLIAPEKQDMCSNGNCVGIAAPLNRSTGGTKPNICDETSIQTGNLGGQRYLPTGWCALLCKIKHQRIVKGVNMDQTPSQSSLKIEISLQEARQGETIRTAQSDLSCNKVIVSIPSPSPSLAAQWKPYLRPILPASRSNLWMRKEESLVERNQLP